MTDKLPEECAVCGGYWDREEHFDRLGELRGIRPYKTQENLPFDPYICGECCHMLLKKLVKHAASPFYESFYPLEEYRENDD